MTKKVEEQRKLILAAIDELTIEELIEFARILANDPLETETMNQARCHVHARIAFHNLMLNAFGEKK